MLGNEDENNMILGKYRHVKFGEKMMQIRVWW